MERCKHYFPKLHENFPTKTNRTHEIRDIRNNFSTTMRRDQTKEIPPKKKKKKKKKLPLSEKK